MTATHNTRLLCFARPAIYCLLLLCIAGATRAADYRFALYAGRLTLEKWEDAIQPDADFADAYVYVLSASCTLARWLEGRLSLELEGQVGKYFGDQDHWEMNLPIFALRWHRFPWQDRVATTFAWGIGSSYASHVPQVELEINKASYRWLVYWFGEITFAPPKASWQFLIRLHHRSNAFGLVADSGGANTLCAGVRYSF